MIEVQFFTYKNYLGSHYDHKLARTLELSEARKWVEGNYDNLPGYIEIRYVENGKRSFALPISKYTASLAYPDINHYELFMSSPEERIKKWIMLGDKRW